MSSLRRCWRGEAIKKDMTLNVKRVRKGIRSDVNTGASIALSRLLSIRCQKMNDGGGELVAPGGAISAG